VAPWVEAFRRLENGRASCGIGPIPTAVTPATIYSRARWPWVVLIVAATLAIGYPVARKLWPSKQATIPGQETTAVAVGVGEPSVAVLPFVDLSDKKDQEYFADGLSGVLIDRLAMVPGLHVPAATSSFYFKGKQADVAEIGRRSVSHIYSKVVSASRVIRCGLPHSWYESTTAIRFGRTHRPAADRCFQRSRMRSLRPSSGASNAVLYRYVPEAARTTNIEATRCIFGRIRICGTTTTTMRPPSTCTRR